MKNIHVLPTDRPSRLYYNINDKIYQLCEISKENTILKPNQNIYITSDEEIRKNDWVLFKSNGATEIVRVTTINNNAFESKQGFGYGLEYCKKIILTTDQDLIKDGVQAIDDEFLEWFVKNPSCEWVETYSLGITDGVTSHHYKYEIIIPKEEPDYTALLQPVGTKQKTLEEAAENYVKDSSHHLYQLRKQCFLDGAKWEQERSYSEEEVLNFTQTMLMQYKFGNTNIEQMDLLRETFQLFKKK